MKPRRLASGLPERPSVTVTTFLFPGFMPYPALVVIVGRSIFQSGLLKISLLESSLDRFLHLAQRLSLCPPCTRDVHTRKGCGQFTDVFLGDGRRSDWRIERGDSFRACHARWRVSGRSKTE